VTEIRGHAAAGAGVSVTVIAVVLPRGSPATRRTHTISAWASAEA